MKQMFSKKVKDN